MSLEQNISNYIKTKGIPLSVISRQTGVAYSALYNSFSENRRKRQLRGKELISICAFLEVDPRQFVEKHETIV